MRKPLYMASLVAAVLFTYLSSANAEGYRDPFNFPGLKLIAAKESKAPYDIPRRWRELRALIERDLEIVHTCNPCSPEANRFREIVQKVKAQDGFKRLQEAEVRINLLVTGETDKDQYGQDDLWVSPLQTLRSLHGDCDKYAVLKYVVLREAGVPDENLRLMTVSTPSGGHMVLEARSEATWYVLNVPDSTVGQMQKYVARYVLDSKGAWKYTKATDKQG